MENHPLVQTGREGFFNKCLRKLLLWALNPYEEYPLMKTFLNGPTFPSLPKYPPIDTQKREIRLDSLKCRLRTVSLDDNPHYTALSYACGTSIWVPTIEIEGKQVAIKPNLGKGLKRLRHPTETVSIWVDAVSIDQDNDVEKAAQVAMMEQIYQSCALVYIWLGSIFIPGVDHCDGMQTRCRSIHEMAPNGWTTISTEEAALTPSGPGDSKQSDVCGAFQIIQSLAQGRHKHEYSWYTDRSEETAAIFKALGTFVMLHWWERIRTAQEPMFPPQAVVVWGPYTAPWRQDLCRGRPGVARLRKHVTTAATVVEWYRLLNQLVPEDENEYESLPYAGHSSVSQDAAFWRTMCRAMLLNDAETRRVDAADYQLFDDYFKLVKMEYVRDGGIDWPAVEEMMNTVYLMTYNSRVFVTERGYFGLGNDDVEEGDEVWVLKGGMVPFVLRSDESSEGGAYEKVQFRLKGDCYLHGVMGGERMETTQGQEKIVVLV